MGRDDFPQMGNVGRYRPHGNRRLFGATEFPLRSGEWTATTPNPMHSGGPPMTMLLCMNDEAWTKALSNRTCSLQDLNITSSGGSYSMACGTGSFQMKGSFKLTFDG